MVQSPNLPASYDEDYDEPEELALPGGTEPTAEASHLEGNGFDGALYNAGTATEEAHTDQDAHAEGLEVLEGQRNGRDVEQDERGQSTPPTAAAAAGNAAESAVVGGQAPSNHPRPPRPMPTSLPPKPTAAAAGPPLSTFSHAPSSAAALSAPSSHAVPPGSNLPPGFTYNPALHPPRQHDLPVPEGLPGDRVADIDVEKYWTLRSHLNELCGIGGTTRFPGSQPISFDLESLKVLEEEDFWVCEKSDGVRVLVLIVATGFGQEVYLIDRKMDVYQNYWLTFPHQDGEEYNHSNTVLDGEFVIDVDPVSGKHIPRLLVFDLLVLDSENVMHRPLEKRYGRLGSFVVKPHQKQLAKLPLEVRQQQPFEVVLKKQELSYGIEAVFRDHVPKLLHGNDGLIFTSAEAPYTPGTDRKILKWKPPSENSIDFLLQLKFPPRADQPAEPDFFAKPMFMLMMNHGHEGNHYYDVMDVDDDTWEEWKASGEQYDDRVVEVVWDASRSTWKMLRFRDDKFEGNYKTVVQSIIKSIQHGVEAEQLVAHAGRIRKAWKARQAARAEHAKREAAAARAVPTAEAATAQEARGGYAGQYSAPPPGQQYSHPSIAANGQPHPPAQNGRPPVNTASMLKR